MQREKSMRPFSSLTPVKQNQTDIKYTEDLLFWGGRVTEDLFQSINKTVATINTIYYKKWQSS